MIFVEGLFYVLFLLLWHLIFLAAGRCHVCGKYELMPFTCKFCGGRFCSEHRLPENHDCTGLAEYRRMLRSEGRLLDNVQGYADVAIERGVGGTMDWLRFASHNTAFLLLLIICVVFLLEYIPWVFNTLVLVPGTVIERPWTLVTYMFLHGGFAHLFFNGMFMFFFGPELERRIGTARFLSIFFISGVLAAVGHMLTSDVGIVGASGALYGVFAALAVIAPHIRIYAFFIPMRITHALILFALLDFLWMGSGDAVAHMAHLSGLVVGLVAGYHLKSRRGLRY
ncbi:rhomboid family intramembrane serine protease [Methanosarcinales archaeon]|nr:MAG: rhomboid family intramembrane serine protease [Methanosarcinales archaeon]